MNEPTSLPAAPNRPIGRRIRGADDRVHYSTLKAMHKSPAHYACGVLTPFEASRAMKVGTLTHQLVLGPQPGKAILIYEGERRGNAWKDFLDEAPPGAEIMTSAELADAQPIAAAVRGDAEAMRWIEGTRRELPLRWTDSGFDCATGGIDCLGGPRNVLADLKVTNSTEPARWSRHARDSMLYHAQMAFYERGAVANGYPVEEIALIGVEATAPYSVTVLHLTPRLLEAGRACIDGWLERLRASEENDFWPGYVQSAVDLDVAPWTLGDDEE